MHVLLAKKMSYGVFKILNLLDALFGQTSCLPSVRGGKGVGEGGFGMVCFVKKTLATGELLPQIIGFAFAML